MIIRRKPLDEEVLSVFMTTFISLAKHRTSSRYPSSNVKALGDASMTIIQIAKGKQLLSNKEQLLRYSSSLVNAQITVLANNINTISSLGTYHGCRRIDFYIDNETRQELFKYERMKPEDCRVELIKSVLAGSHLSCRFISYNTDISLHTVRKDPQEAEQNQLVALNKAMKSLYLPEDTYNAKDAEVINSLAAFRNDARRECKRAAKGYSNFANPTESQMRKSTPVVPFLFEDGNLTFKSLQDAEE